MAAHLKGTAHEWTRQEAREASLKGRRQSQTSGDGYLAQPLRTAQATVVQLDAERPSPWLESLKKNLDELFASQKRVARDADASMDDVAV